MFNMPIVYFIVYTMYIMYYNKNYFYLYYYIGSPIVDISSHPGT